MRWAIERFGIEVALPAEPANEPPAGDLVVPASAMPAQPAAPAESLNVEGLNELFTVEAAETPAADQQFTLSRPGDRKNKSRAGDRLRDALHWMGI
ncbi:MAG TPA: hypothetical protein VEU08_21925 [Vicinamibacterales bacterium]|nr:hypothetical protein [Vicinamibacterales bacterium]